MDIEKEKREKKKRTIEEEREKRSGYIKRERERKTKQENK